MSTEAPVLKRCMLEASKLGLRLFRNNRGLFLTLDGNRKVRAGLEVEGASDLIGITPVKITQDMVGLTLGIFTAAEVKEPDWKYNPNDEHQKKQLNFINQIIKLGGIAFFITDHKKLGDSLTRFIKIGIDSVKQV